MSRWTLLGILVLAGAGWGITQPLAKISVSTGYKPFGLIFWQLAIGTLVLGIILAVQRKALPINLHVMPVYLFIALVGTLIPNSTSYQAVVHLPAGLMSVLLSIIPMLAFPVAMVLGLDRFQWVRLFGLLAGLAGVLLIVLPDASLPEPGLVVWVALALVAPVCYAFEGNLLAKFGLQGLDALQALAGASLVGAVLALPLAVGTGQWIAPSLELGRADWALIAASVIHAVVYTTYVWIVGRAGPTFAAQISYLVTGFGVVWAILLLSESYSIYVWAAMALMFVGLFLVQPRNPSDGVDTT